MRNAANRGADRNILSPESAPDSTAYTVNVDKIRRLGTGSSYAGSVRIDRAHATDDLRPDRTMEVIDPEGAPPLVRDNAASPRCAVERREEHGRGNDVWISDRRRGDIYD